MHFRCMPNVAHYNIQLCWVNIELGAAQNIVVFKQDAAVNARSNLGRCQHANDLATRSERCEKSGHKHIRVKGEDRDRPSVQKSFRSKRRQMNWQGEALSETSSPIVVSGRIGPCICTEGSYPYFSWRPDPVRAQLT